ncbi:sterol desaturase family protein [Fulvivirgaceae bacterium PWU5]|uniref:Sterol desaturase family protein n=1 Tax=Dawidia cretensis TaxID=2782350 RepID=A0AAP2DV53_9BACT|nr:sterol desaturase family protein [Dawidia cretensis]MBT1708008.1 sterol desaturase family protein [Dawidia cretensis]
MNPLTIILCALIVIGTFLFWELVAWFTHKYIMHGFLWIWHRSHHTVHDHALERNDWFAVVFSLPSIGLFYYATLVTYNPYLIAVGLGILCYGIFYFIFHDIIVHQRLRWRPAKRSRYLQRMIHAHYVHHARHTKEDCEAFGFLYAPPKYEPGKFELKKDRRETQ